MIFFGNLDDLAQLSHTSAYFIKKANAIVDTWVSKFHTVPKEERVPFLHLSNGIVQNSRREGLKFVNAFWTVLLALLRDVLHTGDDSVRNSANRLVNIWEDMRVFGLRGQSLHEEMFGKGSQSPKQEAKQSSLVNNQVIGWRLLNLGSSESGLKLQCDWNFKDSDWVNELYARIARGKYSRQICTFLEPANGKVASISTTMIYNGCFSNPCQISCRLSLGTVVDSMNILHSFLETFALLGDVDFMFIELRVL